MREKMQFLALLVVVLHIIYSFPQSCENWFGANCKYKCHCKNNVACNVTNGDCPNGCDSGWFGPACQYADIVKNATLTPNNDLTQEVDKITDGDDSTCASLTGSNLELNVTWSFEFYFTWLRIVVWNTELQKESISIKFPDNVTTQHMTCVNVIIDNVTLDIYCNISKVTKKIRLHGSAVDSLCSLYITEGRNVALKQPTNQTTTEHNHVNHLSNKAVDGNRNWVNNSCTHTNTSSDPAPMLTLVFNHTVRVQAYTIYNRVGSGIDAYCCLVRLKGFILTTFDQTNQNIQRYTDNQTSPQEVYNVLPTDPWAQVSMVQIEATYFNINSQSFNTKVLTLCEVEIFGDSVCPKDNFTYGRDCENVCNCAVEGEKCFVSTGNCPSGCKAGFYGQGCTKHCAAGYFGIDCRNKCSNNCSSQQCERVDGKCYSCALKGKKLPYCTQDCDPGFYGADCKSNCSRNCSQTGPICDVINGNCSACNPGSYGNKCTAACPANCKNSVCDLKTGNCESCKSGFYGHKCTSLCSNSCKDARCEINSGNCTSCNSGSNCTTSCPTNCTDLVCDINSGNCISCQAGYQGSRCVEECSNHTYGENCKSKCSSNCITSITDDRICHRVNGQCHNGCLSGFEGSNCTVLKSTSNINTDDSKNLIIGAVVGSICGVIGVLLVIGGVFILWRRNKRSDQLPPGENTSSMENLAEADSLSNVTSTSKQEQRKSKHTVKPTIPQKPKLSNIKDGATCEEKGNGYYNTVTLQPITASTVITLSNLHSYLLTHSKEYLNEQFKNLPVNTEATMTVGLSAENKNKNRYKNICAYDHSRVHLEADTTKMHGDYINASYLKGYNDEEKFIASQGPNKIILNDFIRMLWEQKVEKVVMLTNLTEEGRSKCDPYWPDEGETTFGEIRVRLAATQVFADYIIRRLQLYVDSQPMHPVTQFHFTSWPDKGVPENPWALVDFEQRVAFTPTKRPIVVHCSAGVGRTGTFIALRNVMREAEDTHQMDFFNTVAKLRHDRTMMIQTAEQYVFLHEAAKVAMTCINTTITSNNIADRVQMLQRRSVSGKTEMEIEFEAVCKVSVDDSQITDEEGSAGVMYQNSRIASNKLKNRFGNILPKELYRPGLMCDSEDMGDYINTVLTPSFRKRNQDIITQLPLPTTVVDFWRLITQMKISLVVAFEEQLQATDSTIGKYLPVSETEKASFPPFQVSMGTWHQGSHWEERKLFVTGSDEAAEHCVVHLRYTQNATDPKELLAFLKHARTYNPKQEARILYMCRNGATFSGLACVLTLLLDRMDNDQRLTVPLVVGAIKTIRPEVIPTVEQYKVLYQVLHRYNETNSVYSNFNDPKLSVPSNDDVKDKLGNVVNEGTEYANAKF